MKRFDVSDLVKLTIQLELTIGEAERVHAELGREIERRREAEAFGEGDTLPGTPRAIALAKKAVE